MPGGFGLGGASTLDPVSLVEWPRGGELRWCLGGGLIGPFVVVVSLRRCSAPVVPGRFRVGDRVGLLDLPVYRYGAADTVAKRHQ